MSQGSAGEFAFFLGGHDLEMETIRDLLTGIAPDRVFDAGLAWGAKASAYRDEIARAVAQNLTPVLIELPDDIGLDHAIVVVDHHGARAGETARTSLHQVFDLVGAPLESWSRWHDLVAANDRGHIREMRRIGASDEEIRRVRRLDRAAQGVTETEERLAEYAVRNAEHHANGRLVVIRLPHAHASAAADRLELRPLPPENVLVISPGEVNFFGTGELVKELDERYPGGWSGGALPVRGFWGHSPVPSDVLDFLVAAVERRSDEVKDRSAVAG